MASTEEQMTHEERQDLLERLPAGTPLTLERAALLAGYRSASTLRKAVRENRLQVTRHSERVVLTTAQDLRAYLERLHAGGASRGQPRKSQGTGEDEPAD